MIPNVYTVPDERTAPLFARAFARGCGGKIVREYTPGAWAGFGSPITWDSLKRAQAAGDDWYYGDHAYFGRGIFYRATKNAYQHSGEPCAADLARGKTCLHRLGISVRPWNRRGKNIIICPQTEGFFERHGYPRGTWLSGVLNALEGVTDRPVLIHQKRDIKPLASSLKDAWCVIVHTSNAALDALMAGVPVICTGVCPAGTLGLSEVAQVENPVYPSGRLEMAATLAANQWTLEEIAQGQCWKVIR